MRVLVVAGARPNFMKVAPIVAALDAHGVDRTLVHTGQHYDAAMSDTFFRELGIPAPDRHLGVGSGTHAVQTARLMTSFEPVLDDIRPDWVVVVGDVNSTLACALVAAKLRPQLGCRLAHVEAGLRSNDWSMPEEVNRVVTDRLSDLLLIPSTDARENLLREGLDPVRIAFVGNVMIDTLLKMLPVARTIDAAGQIGIRRARYVVCTLHRPSNVDAAGPLRVILSSLGAIAKEVDVVLPLHPRTRKRVEEFGLASLLLPLIVTEPIGYTLMLALQAGAAAMVTDSGGIQEESTVLGVPCVTVRESTERPVTVAEGTNRLAPWPLTEEGLLGALVRALNEQHAGVGARAPKGWDGHAGERVVRTLMESTVPGLGVQAMRTHEA